MFKLFGASLVFAACVLPVAAQRLDTPGTITDRATITPISRVAVAKRCSNNGFRAKNSSECKRSYVEQSNIKDRSARTKR